MNSWLVGPLAAGLWLALAAAASAQETPNVGRLVEFVRWSGVAASIAIILGTLAVLRLIEGVSTSLGTRFANRRPLIQKLESALRFGLYLASLMVCVGLSIRLDPTALTLIGGTLAFALGFAMRDLVAAFIAGVTIMFDRPFHVGDRVAIAGEYGDILQIGLRSVRMNTLDHNIITIPNNRILTDVTSSGNYGELEMQVAMDFYVGIDQDLELAIALVREACLTSPYVHLALPVPVLVKQHLQADWVAYHLKARPYVFDNKYEKPFETDVHLRVAQAFRAAGVNPPAVLHRPQAG